MRIKIKLTVWHMACNQQPDPLPPSCPLSPHPSSSSSLTSLTGGEMPPFLFPSLPLLLFDLDDRRVRPVFSLLNPHSLPLKRRTGAEDICLSFSMPACCVLHICALHGFAFPAHTCTLHASHHHHLLFHTHHHHLSLIMAHAHAPRPHPAHTLPLGTTAAGNADCLEQT